MRAEMLQADGPAYLSELRAAALQTPDFTCGRRCLLTLWLDRASKLSELDTSSELQV